jgi:hypothetical protein
LIVPDNPRLIRGCAFWQREPGADFEPDAAAIRTTTCPVSTTPCQ